MLLVYLRQLTGDDMIGFPFPLTSTLLATGYSATSLLMEYVQTLVYFPVQNSTFHCPTDECG